jgi:hypothetical protein
MSEPLVVVHGKHREDFELLGQDAARLGSVVCVDRARCYEFRDLNDRCAVKLRDLAPSTRLRGLWKWRYEVISPGGGETISVMRVSRRKDPATIAQGSRQVGVLRRISRPAALTKFPRVSAVIGLGTSESLVVEDHTGRQTARVHIVENRLSTKLVELIVEVEDGTSEQLRMVALAASLIAERELINWAVGGGSGL